MLLMRAAPLAVGSLLLTVLIGGSFASPAPALEIPVLGISITPPPAVTVGQTDVPGTVRLTSSSPIPVALSEIALDPACVTVSASGDCNTADPGDLVLSSTATGTGGGCPRTVFSVVGPDAAGRYVFVPPATVMLLPFAAGTCTIAYRFNVVMAPPVPAVHQVATVAGFAALPVLASTAIATAVVGVERAAPGVTAQATPASASLGDAINDMATVASVAVDPNTPGPTGTVTFAAYGPGNPSCTGSPAFTSSARPLSSGQAQATPFTPIHTGTYNWTVAYSGDQNYAPAQSACTVGTSVGETTVTLAAASQVAGGAVVATATVTGGQHPTGDLTFSFFGITDLACAQSPVSTSPPVAVDGDGIYRAPAVPAPSGAGYFVVGYGGDANNLVATTPCRALASVAVPTTTAPAPSVPTPTTPRRPTAVPPIPATGLELYDPFAHPRQVVTLEVSAFALLSTVGAAGGASAAGAATGGGQGTPSDADGASGSTGSSGSSGSSSQGAVVSAGIDNTSDGWSGVAMADEATEARWGDRSWTWRWPGTRGTDKLSRDLPEHAAPASPLVARVLNDAGYLRAMLGSAATLFPVFGIVLGIVAVGNTQGHALPPEFWLAMALAVLGVFDALAGFLAVTVFVTGVILSGGVATTDSARTLLGLSALWFVAPIIAGAARPLRRDRTLTPAQHFDRFSDVVIASLVGAWGVQQILQGLPGLSGLALPIAAKADEAALLVLGALAVRMIAETVAAHGYPRRLRAVQQADLPGSSLAQRLGARLLTLAIFVFVALPYIGPCWQLYAGGVLFLTPPLLSLVRSRFPNYPGLYTITPKGIVRTVVLLLVGALLGAIVLGYFHNNRELIRDSFVLLSLPAFLFTMVDLIARDGPQHELQWHHKAMGALVLATGILLVLGIIAV